MSPIVNGENVSHFVIGRKGGTAEKCLSLYVSGKVSHFICVRKCRTTERWDRGKVGLRKGNRGNLTRGNLTSGNVT